MTHYRLNLMISFSVNYYAPAKTTNRTHADFPLIPIVII